MPEAAVWPGGGWWRGAQSKPRARRGGEQETKGGLPPRGRAGGPCRGRGGSGCLLGAGRGPCGGHHPKDPFPLLIPSSSLWGPGGPGGDPTALLTLRKKRLFLETKAVPGEQRAGQGPISGLQSRHPQPVPLWSPTSEGDRGPGLRPGPSAHGRAALAGPFLLLQVDISFLRLPAKVFMRTKRHGAHELA